VDADGLKRRVLFMIHAKDYNSIIQGRKERKFKVMLNTQEDFIKENMQEGKRNVVWIFSDPEYYCNSSEKQWYAEFNNRAKEIFEKQGFAVNAITIEW
jgi:peptidase E